MKVNIDGKMLAPHRRFHAMILQKLKADAEGYLGEKVTKSSHHGSCLQRRTASGNTRDTGKIAGLDVKRIINRPTAALWT